MTNRELLAAPAESLDGPRRQRRHGLRVELTPLPCPACLVPLDALRVAGVDIDAYAFGTEPRAYCCPGCGAELEQVVPLIAAGPSWHWQLKRAWLTDRLRKATLYDLEHEEGQ